MSQSIEEKEKVLYAFEKSEYFPKGLLQTEHNTNVIRRAIAGKHLTISVLVEIFAELGDLATGGELEYYHPPAPPEKIIVEIERKKTPLELKRDQNALGKGNHRTELDDPLDKPQQPSWLEQSRTATENAKQNKAKTEIDVIVSGYQAMRGARVDHAKTARDRKGLSEIRVFTDATRQIVDWVKTLHFIKEAVSKMG